MLNEGQKKAVEKIVRWYYDINRKKNLFLLCAPAGCGKSYTVKFAVKALGLEPYQVLYVTPTGKASTILRAKGVPANTIHSTFYRLFKDGSGKVHFVKKEKVPNNIALIVIDEVSMVSDYIKKDLETFGIPIVALGDTNQLGPVKATNKFMDKPDAVLTEPMRQAKDSGILTLAYKAMRHELIEVGQYKESNVVRFEDVMNKMDQYDIVICWRNETRMRLNSKLRSMFGHHNPYPEVGEKLICLRNSYFYEQEIDDMQIILANGLELTNVSPIKIDKSNPRNLKMRISPTWFAKDIVFEVDAVNDVFECYARHKFNDDVEDWIRLEENEVLLDYGYCITVGKAQGSEWAKVLVIDEFRGSGDNYFKWLYTAITRASQMVTIAKV